MLGAEVGGGGGGATLQECCLQLWWTFVVELVYAPLGIVCCNTLQTYMNNSSPRL